MAVNTHTGNGALADSSITSATIDNTASKYYIKLDHAADTNDCYIYGVRITYTITEPKP